MQLWKRRGIAWKKQADNLNQHIILLATQGKYEEALPFATQLSALISEHLEDQALAYVATLANFYREAGDYARAIPLHLQSLEIMRDVLGEQHPQVAACLNNLAMLYKDTGDYTRAAQLNQQALTLRRALLGEQHPDVAQSLNNLALIYHAAGDYHHAVSTLQQALEITRAALGEQHPQVALSLENLAEIYREMGDYARAIPLHQQALEITRATLGEQHPQVATCLNNLAALYHDMGDYARATSLYEQALMLRRTILGEQHPEVIPSFINLATLYYDIGDHARAASLYEQALEITRATLGDQHPLMATCLNNLAALYDQMGDYTRAMSLYEQALEITRAALGEHHPQMAACLNNLGSSYAQLGDHARAASLYEQALEITRATLGDQHLQVAICLKNLAGLYQIMGDSVRYTPLLEQALTIRRNTLGEQHPDVASSLEDLANAYRVAGDYSQAVSLLVRALDIRRAALGDQHPDMAQSLNNLAMMYHAVGDYKRAAPLLQQALTIRRTALGEQHPQVATSLENLALVYLAIHRHDDAWSLLLQSAEIDDYLIRQIFSIGSERQRMTYLATLQAHVAICLSAALYLPFTTSEKVLAAFDLVLRRKGIAAEALAAQREALLQNRYPDLRPVMQEHAELRQRIAQKRLAGPGADGLLAYERDLETLDHRKEELEGQLAKAIPEMNLQLRLREADRQAVAAALPRDAALIEFVHLRVFDFHAVPARGGQTWKPARYLAFVLHAGKPDDVHMTDLGEADRIDQLVSMLRTSITGEHEPEDDRQVRRPTTSAAESSSHADAGAALYEAIIAPLTTELGDCKRLFLAPDGGLTRLPFEILPIGNEKRLIDVYHLSYLGVGRDVLRIGTPFTSEPSVSLIVGDPDFDLAGGDKNTAQPPLDVSREKYAHALKRDGRYFSSLPKTRVEGEQIAKLLRVQLLSGANVLEQSLKAISSPRILHLATHGFFLEDQPTAPTAALTPLGIPSDDKLRWVSKQENPLLRSGLALAGANTWLQGGVLPSKAEDGLLTAEDVTGLDLSSTELVVLSACETGLGEVHIGEGVFGLRRAFTLAGARRLIMSLWKVPDQQTQELMVKFYQSILQGQSCSEALRETQLAMKAKYPAPYIWGAFICQGDPGALLPEVAAAPHAAL